MGNGVPRAMLLFLRSLLWLLVTVVTLPLVGQDAPAPVAVETEGPAQLLERGRQAFAASNFAEAEEALEKFIGAYAGRRAEFLDGYLPDDRRGAGRGTEGFR